MKNENKNEIKVNVENENDIPAAEAPEVPVEPETVVTVEVKKNLVEKFVDSCYAKRVQKAEKKAEKQAKEKGKFGEKLRKAAVPVGIGLTVLGGAAVKMLLRGGTSTNSTQSGEEPSVETADIPVTETTDPAVEE